MSIETSDALVLRTVEFSESSLIVTLFSRNFGKIRAIAKGARRLKNPFESALDLLARICVSFIRKNSDSLDLLTEAKLINRFRLNQKNLGGMYAGFYLTELLDAFTADYQVIPELYDFAADILTRFQEGKNVELGVLKFEWGILKITGLKPSTRFCVSCGKELSLEDYSSQKRKLYFAPNEGGVLCPECARQYEFQQIMPVSAEAILLINDLNRDLDPDRLIPDSFSKSARGEVRKITSTCICNILGWKPRMHDYLKLMTSAK